MIIDLNDRYYIDYLLTEKEKQEEIAYLLFEMPPFVSGEFKSQVYVDPGGERYISSEHKRWVKSCRDFSAIRPDGTEIPRSRNLGDPEWNSIFEDLDSPQDDD